MINTAELTVDGFLSNRLRISQPRSGFRAGHDSVLLAASVPIAQPGHALELGSGVGVASLCVAARASGCRVTGMEIDPELVAVAIENAKRNQMSERVDFVVGDVLESALDGARFDQVFLNPPFHPSAGQKSPDTGRARAMHDTNDVLDVWTARAIGLVRPGGSVTVIMRADRLAEWWQEVSGALTVMQLLPREGQEPKRAIARLRPGVPSSFRTVKSLILHREDGKPTEAAEAVLRHGAPLSFD